MFKSDNFKIFFSLLLIIFVSTNIENHNKPFGTGKRFAIEQHEGFIEPIIFFENYVLKKKPLLFKHAAKDWPAIKNWNDSHFLRMNLSRYNNTIVHVEVQKKENRSLATLNMEFKEFVKTYNQSDMYLVDKLPTFLDSDVFVPWSLQCLPWEDSINQVLMWFSSGGTSSVVHTDDMENINCLISGEKVFVLVDPVLHKDKIPLRSEGAYSDIDVDRVDFNKYPGMATVDFQIANMTAGDCLFIPRLWLHQVRSFGRNIAINIWFSKTRHELEALTHEDLRRDCSPLPEKRTFLETKFMGLGQPSTVVMDLMTLFNGTDAQRLMDTVIQSYPNLYADTFDKIREHVQSIIKDIFLELDHNKNTVIELDEILASSKESVGRITNFLKYLKLFLESVMISAESTSQRGHKDAMHKNLHSEL